MPDWISQRGSAAWVRWSSGGWAFGMPSTKPTCYGMQHLFWRREVEEPWIPVLAQSSVVAGALGGDAPVSSERSEQLGNRVRFEQSRSLRPGPEALAVREAAQCRRRREYMPGIDARSQRARPQDGMRTNTRNASRRRPVNGRAMSTPLPPPRPGPPRATSGGRGEGRTIDVGAESSKCGPTSRR